MKRFLSCAAIAALLIATVIHAQWSPTLPVRLVVPFPPGGAYAILGTEIAAKAAPDGHTLLMVAAGHAITPSVIRKLPHDPIKDFAAIGFVGNGAFVLVVGPTSPAKSVSEFIALAKSRPGKLNYAHTSYGNVAHLSAELFKALAGVDIQDVPYKGGGPALTDLMGGQISAFFAGMASSSALIQGGKIRALGVTTARRAASLPDLPTIAEAGMPGYEVDGWYGMAAPAATPPTAIRRFNSELVALLALPEVKARLLVAGIDASPSTPEAFQALITRDIARWAEVVKKAKISVEQ